MNKNPFIPVKITAKKWADKFQSGSVYMQSLYEFGTWSVAQHVNTKDKKMIDGVHIDVGEGIVRTVDPKIGDAYFNSIEPDIRKVMKFCCYIDQDLYQYYKVFCMYGLTYDMDKCQFERPDNRLKEFGNTVVIITKPNIFLKRLLESLYKKYGDNFNFKLDEIKYYPKNYYGDLNEFCKSDCFAWQNECRIRIALLDGTSTIEKNGQFFKELIQSVDPITLEIGDISDITTQIKVEDLINLKLPDIIDKPNFDDIFSL